jgi:phthiocerol/phenolphthiocerol synthesis type-I polyketide synthase E
MKHYDGVDERDLFGIAIIGMAGRFPDARNVDEFWRNLSQGVESIRPFAGEELMACGVDEALLSDSYFVNAGTVMPDADRFDAAFFGINTREAEIMDPQHRVFLETAWEALEDAGYDPENYPGSIGLYGGVGPNAYYQRILATRPDLLHTLGRYAVMLASEREYAVTRVSYKLNLRGPSLSVSTACSTSAVAIHVACQSLLGGECDMALAGGARVSVPLKGGYSYVEGGILSPDGHCRAFDAEARGTVGGNGVGIIVLKRLSDAVQDNDSIHAIIRGSAVNNDGSEKVGFTAPSIQGQAAVIEDALAMADVIPDSIGYIEAHGTGTSLGDPIEIAALTEAFRNWTDRSGYCLIGSVKTNIGHLDAAAGVAGVIKTVLALKHEQIPPSLNFQRPNPQIDFEKSPFRVNAESSAWPVGATARRAGVSSFGLGGTNAHIILEEAPAPRPSGPSRARQLLLISARSDAALAQATKNVVDHVRQQPEVDLADVAYTLQTGRRAFERRRMVVCEDADDAISALEPIDPRRVVTSDRAPVERDVVFMFSGQGSQYVNMGLELYESESVFRQQVDRCSEILKPCLSVDLREILYPDSENEEEAARMLKQTSLTQPALFVIEYALAMLWIDWGMKPHAMVGHSIGEYVAACLAGVFSLEEALALVASRARLMQELPSGSMLAVPLTEGHIQPYLDGTVSLAVVNSPSLCVVSGGHEAIKSLEAQLSREGVETRYLHTSHAFHSAMMEPILDPFRAEVVQARPRAPQIPFLSNVTGDWISSEEAADPDYWTKHLRQTVRFSDCLHQVCAEPNRVLLEVGPGRTLATLARQHPDKSKELVVLSSIRHPQESIPDQVFILNTLGQLWLSGIQPDWSRFYADERRHRVGLPTYPFERKHYWLSPGSSVYAATPTGSHQLSEFGGDHVSEAIPAQESIGTYDGAPRNEVERALANIWEGLLGVKSLSIYDNFFEAGGSSLLATRLFTQIADRFGKRLPLSTVFEAPTIEQLAGLLEQDISPPTHSSLVRVQGGQSRPPLFCLPGNLGNVFTDLGFLSRHLGPDQPFYGLQDGLGHPSDVKALAAHYVEDIRQMQPEGPYMLAGICSGGVVAYEMAQQLVNQGHSVALLALLEPATLPLPDVRSYVDLVTEIWARFTQRAGGDARKVTRLSWVERLVYLRLRRKLIANIWALKRYHPSSYPGRFHLFLTGESITNSPRPLWLELITGESSVHEIPGTHRSITGDNESIEEDQMRALGEKLRECIEDALKDDDRA